MESHNIYPDVYLKNNDVPEFFTKLMACKRSGSFCDVILKADIGEIPAHRIILSTIPYFEFMFQDDFRGKNEKIIEMRNIDPETLNYLINVSYGAEIKLTYGNIERFFCGADFLQWTALKKDLVKFLTLHLNAEMVLTAIKIAEVYNCPELLPIAQDFIDFNFSEFASTGDFCKLESSELISIIKREELRVPEEKIYEAVMKWIKFSIEDRSFLLPEILSNVRMCLLTSEYLNNVVRREVLIGTSAESRNLLEEAINYHLSSTKLSLKNIQCRPRSAFSNCLYSPCHGQLYNSKEDTWIPVELPKTDLYEIDVVFDKKFYSFQVAGDENKGKVVCIDIETKEMKEMSSKVPVALGVQYYRRHSYHSTVSTPVIFEGSFYFCGGHDNTDIGQRTVHCYSPKQNLWSNVAPLLKARYDNKAVALNGSIYVIGGKQNYNTWSKTCEKYDPKSNTWSFVQCMQTRRDGFAVAELEGKIYAAGGNVKTNTNFDDVSTNLDDVSTNLCEVYDPSSDKWSYVAPMKRKRKDFELIAHRRKIYAIGGSEYFINGDSISLCLCEAYDPVLDTWTFVAPPQ